MSNAEKVKELEGGVEKALEDLKESICDICVWPFKETDQEAMTDRCDSCKIIKKLDEVMSRSRGAGYARATLDFCESLAIARDRTFGGGENA